VLGAFIFVLCITAFSLYLSNSDIL